MTLCFIETNRAEQGNGWEGYGSIAQNEVSWVQAQELPSGLSLRQGMTWTETEVRGNE